MFMLVTHRPFDTAREAELTRWIDDQLVPALQRQAGFAGYNLGFDRERGRLFSVIRWQTRAQAQRIRDVFGDLLSDLDRLGTTRESSAFFEEIRHTSLGIGCVIDPAIGDPRVDVTPISFFNRLQRFCDGALAADELMIPSSTPLWSSSPVLISPTTLA